MKLKSVYLNRVDNKILNLIILPTQQCNFRCKYCYESFPDIYMDRALQDGIIRYVKRCIRMFSGVHISWFGGEPLLAVDTIEYISMEIKKICQFYKKTFTANMTTNGYLLTTDTFRRLLRCNVLNYQITIDGTKEVHDRQRVHVQDEGATFDVIMENLLSIKNEIKSSLFCIDIRSNFSADLADKVKAYKAYFGQKFLNDDRFQFYINAVADLGGEQIDEFRDSLLNKSEMQYIYGMLAETDTKMNFSYADSLNPGGCMCEAGQKNTFVITARGEISKCTCHFEKEQARIGYINSDGEMKIDRYQEDEWLCDSNTCQNEDCFFAPICLRDSCPALRILGKEKRCPSIKSNLASILLLLDSDNNIFKKVGCTYDTE